MIEFADSIEYINMNNYVLKLFLVESINANVTFEDFLNLDEVKPVPKKASTAHTMISMFSSY